jgi:hypothetical protein
VVKSRGMSHSNSVHEYVLNNTGLQILDGDPAVREARLGGV